MNYAYFDIDSINPALLVKGVKSLSTYRKEIHRVKDESDSSVHEYALAHVKQAGLHDTLSSVKTQFKGIKHLILVGIGGQDLGPKAVHTVLGNAGVTLHSLDTIAPYQVSALFADLAKVKNVKKLAVVVSSKSGATAETLVNAGVLLDSLKKIYGKDIYKQSIFIGTEHTDFFATGKRLGVTTIGMPEIVGGRYSVATEAGLVPLALLNHDTDGFIEGVLDASHEQFEAIVAENAVRLHHYISKNYRHYNFFAFEPRLYKLGAWYRQLVAESLGKAEDTQGKAVTKGFLPTITTPVELHSVGQLYMSGFAGVYTDFVTFDDVSNNYKIPKQGIAKQYGSFDMQEVATALYGGVVCCLSSKAASVSVCHSP
jgi:glucose-6-phosphate isomerase